MVKIRLQLNNKAGKPANLQGLFMQHWITRTGFCFYVGKSEGMRNECAVFPDGIVAGFYNEDHAIKFAQSQHDALNFVMIYDQGGQTIKTFSPCGFSR